MTCPRNRPLLRQDRWDEAAYLFKSAAPWVVGLLFVFSLAFLELAWIAQ